VRALTLLPALALLAAAPAAAQPPQTASVSLSSARAGARPVAVTLVLGYDMQCGYPGPGPVLVAFPTAMQVPAQLPASAVLVDGHAAPGVLVSGRRVTVNLAPPPQIMCDVIGPGKLTLAFTRAAGIGNPRRPGTYTVAARRAATAFSAAFAVRA
jgi:hypothetical protein